MYANSVLEDDHFLPLEAIMDYRTNDHAVLMVDRFVTVKRRQYLRKTRRRDEISVLVGKME